MKQSGFNVLALLKAAKDASPTAVIAAMGLLLALAFCIGAARDSFVALSIAGALIAGILGWLMFGRKD